MDTNDKRKEADPPPVVGNSGSYSHALKLVLVPYAGRSPPMLVGGARCWVEPYKTGGGLGLMAKPPTREPAAMWCNGSLTTPAPASHTGAATGTQMTGEKEPKPHSRQYRWFLSPCSEACGWCLMLVGTLPCLWLVPYAGRNPPKHEGAMGEW